MKKDYKRPSIEVVKMEQVLLSGSDPNAHNQGGSGNQFAPGYGGKGRGRYDEDDFDEEEEEEF
ncbi:MAG: hypothetical protein K6D61_04370 [Prevotella sp.]|nr:hypothetical protein [Prevotella sp.]